MLNINVQVVCQFVCMFLFFCFSGSLGTNIRILRSGHHRQRNIRSTRQITAGGRKKALPCHRKHQRHRRVQGKVRDHPAHKRGTPETADGRSSYVQQGQVQGHLRPSAEWPAVSGSSLRRRTSGFSRRSKKRATDVNSGLVCIGCRIFECLINSFWI